MIAGEPANVGEEVDDENGPRVRLHRQQIEFQDDYLDNEGASEEIDSEDEDEPSAAEVEAASNAIFADGNGPRPPRPKRQAKQGKLMLAVASLLQDDYRYWESQSSASSDFRDDEDEAEDEHSDG